MFVRCCVYYSLLCYNALLYNTLRYYIAHKGAVTYLYYSTLIQATRSYTLDVFYERIKVTVLLLLRSICLPDLFIIYCCVVMYCYTIPYIVTIVFLLDVHYTICAATYYVTYTIYTLLTPVYCTLYYQLWDPINERRGWAEWPVTLASYQRSWPHILCQINPAFFTTKANLVVSKKIKA